MSRRSVIKKRYPKPDSNYNSCLVSLLTARILKSGKKSLADSIILETFALIQEKTNLDPLQVFEKAIQNITPLVEVKARRIGGSTYQWMKKLALKPAVGSVAGYFGADAEMQETIKNLIFPFMRVGARGHGSPIGTVDPTKTLNKGDWLGIPSMYDKASEGWGDAYESMKPKGPQIYDSPIPGSQGNPTNVADMIMTKDGRMIQTDPEDNLIAKKGEITQNTGGGGSSRVIQLLEELVRVNKNVIIQIDGQAVAQSVNEANFRDS